MEIGNSIERDEIIANSTTDITLQDTSMSIPECCNPQKSRNSPD